MVNLFPNDARLRDLTYHADISVDVDVTRDSQEVRFLCRHVQRRLPCQNCSLCSPHCASFHFSSSLPPLQVDENNVPIEPMTETITVGIGKLPLMLRSNFCALSFTRDLTETNECPLDPGGYFIINGSEKVRV